MNSRLFGKGLGLLAAAGFLAVIGVQAAEPAPEPKKWALFEGKQFADWEPVDIGGSGQVEHEGDTMVIRQGEGLSGVVYKKTQGLPTTRYEISLEAKRLEGVDFFCGLTFPVGDWKTCATLICGGWGGSVTGISSIDGMDASNNNTGSYQKYEDGRWYKIRLRVTPANLSVWIDDRQVVDQDIKGRKIGLRPGPIESYQPLALTTFNTTAAIRRVRLTELRQ